MCEYRKLIYISCQGKCILIYSFSKPIINKKILSDHRKSQRLQWQDWQPENYEIERRLYSNNQSVYNGV